MNSLDVVIIIALVLFFAARQRLSFVMYFFGSLGLFYGYLAGLLITVALNDRFATDLSRGIFALASSIILAVMGAYAGARFGNWLRMRILQSRFYRYDKLFALPYKVIVAVCSLWILSQTIIYIPVVAVQYLAQGSGLMLNIDKHTTPTIIEGIAHDIAPGQFKERKLEYDLRPLTYDAIANAGEFNGIAKTVAPSVVKISGRMCPAFGRGVASGSGFVVAPGYVVTNAHVVIGISTLYIRTHNATYPATPMIIDEKHDIAVLYAKFLTDEKPMKFATIKPPEGTNVLVMGYPSAGDLAVLPTTTVNNNNLKLNQDKTALTSENSLKFASGLWKGSSGGPIINANGQVVAVTFGSDGVTSLGIDAAIAKDLADKAQKRLYATHTGYCAVFKGYN
jgi:S1-C subfamily serine protease